MAGILMMALSVAALAYGLHMLMYYEFATGTFTSHGASEAAASLAPSPPYFIIPVSMGVAGLAASVFMVLTISRDGNGVSLRKKILHEGFDGEVYRIFSGRGGHRRMAILQCLEEPRLRNEIANITGTDWKEVDRNVGILESASLVRKEYSHRSLSVYSLTESGKELLGIMHSVNGTTLPDAGAQRS